MIFVVITGRRFITPDVRCVFDVAVKSIDTDLLRRAAGKSTPEHVMEQLSQPFRSWTISIIVPRWRRLIRRSPYFHLAAPQHPRIERIKNWRNFLRKNPGMTASNTGCGSSQTTNLVETIGRAVPIIVSCLWTFLAAIRRRGSGSSDSQESYVVVTRNDDHSPFVGIKNDFEADETNRTDSNSGDDSNRFSRRFGERSRRRSGK